MPWMSFEFFTVFVSPIFLLRCLLPDWSSCSSRNESRISTFWIRDPVKVARVFLRNFPLSWGVESTGHEDFSTRVPATYFWRNFVSRSSVLSRAASLACWVPCFLRSRYALLFFRDSSFARSGLFCFHFCCRSELVFLKTLISISSLTSVLECTYAIMKPHLLNYTKKHV